MANAVASNRIKFTSLLIASTINMKKIGESIGELFHWVSPGRKFVYYFDEGSSEDRGRLSIFIDFLCY